MYRNGYCPPRAVPDSFVVTTDMRAIASSAAGPQLVHRPEPQIEADDEIKVRTIAVGVCGTDRTLLQGQDTERRAGDWLVLGHEMLGQVIETGAAVQRVEPGDLAVFTVRRGCGECVSCAQQRSDMCST